MTKDLTVEQKGDGFSQMEMKTSQNIPYSNYPGAQDVQEYSLFEAILNWSSNKDIDNLYIHFRAIPNMYKKSFLCYIEGASEDNLVTPYTLQLIKIYENFWYYFENGKLEMRGLRNGELHKGLQRITNAEIFAFIKSDHFDWGNSKTKQGEYIGIMVYKISAPQDIKVDLSRKEKLNQLVNRKIKWAENLNSNNPDQKDDYKEFVHQATSGKNKQGKANVTAILEDIFNDKNTSVEIKGKGTVKSFKSYYFREIKGGDSKVTAK